jgi:hypothetical protein
MAKHSFQRSGIEGVYITALQMVVTYLGLVQWYVRVCSSPQIESHAISACLIRVSRTWFLALLIIALA